VPGNLKQLRGLHEAGVFGFKCFLLDSGVDEFPPLPPDELEPVLAEIAALGSVLTVHAEDAEDAEAIDRGARTHVLHLSSSDALPMLDSARRDGVAVTVETCPHYLTFTAETSRTVPPSSSAARRSARRPTTSCCGRDWPTG
jgi:allantoinase